MITKTITGQNQWTNPLYVPSGTSFSFSVAQKTTDPVTSWVSKVTVQFIPDETLGMNLPNAADSRWTVVDSFDMTSTPVTKVGSGNCGWFRVGVATGDYVSGNADVKVWLSR